jgi:phage-related minor tail protein
MAETTGGNSGATGGGSAGGSQVENLTLGVQVPGAQQAEQALDSFGNAVIKVGTATVRSMVSINDLNKALDENAQWTDKSRASFKALEDAVNAQYAAEQKALQVTLARIDAATKFEAKLAEMVQTFGYSKTEMLAYQAAELGVLDSTKGLIDTLDKLTETQRQNAIQQQRDIEMYRAAAAETERQTKIQQDRDTWEHEQRAKKYADYVSFWEKTLAAQDANDAKYLKAEQDRVDREKEINQQRDVWLNNQRQRERTSYEQWWGDQLKQQETALQKQLSLDISYGEKSLKQKIETLQKIAAYQADPRTGQAGVDLTSMFGAKAVGDVGKLDQLIKEYNDTLGKHGKKLGEASEAAGVWGKMLDNNRIRTEAIVLAHEALQGRYTRMPGSLMVMTEYMTAANIPVASAIGLVAGLSAALVGLVYEIAKGQGQFKELANSLVRTNDFAGTTAGQLDVLAHSVANAHGNFKEAYEAINALTRSGKFTQDQIKGIADATVTLNHSMGTDLNTTIKEFESLSVRSTTNASRGSLQISTALEKLDQQYHFVNATQMQYVIQLEKEGKLIEASKEATELYRKEVKRAGDEGEENIGSIQRAWEGVLGVIKKAAQGIADIGKANKELRAEKMHEALQAIIPKDRNNPYGEIETDESKIPAGTVAMLRDYLQLKKEIAEDEKKAAERGKQREVQSQADHVMIQRAAEDRSLLKKSASELEDALLKNSEQLTKILAANPSYFDDPKNVEYEDDRLQAILKAHTQKAAKTKDDGRKEDLLSALQHVDAMYKMQEDASDAQITLLKKQYKAGAIGQEDYYQRSTELRQKELADLEKNEQEKLAIIDRYKPKSKVDERNVAKRRQQVLDDYEAQKAAIEQAQAAADQTNDSAQFDKWVDGINKVAAAEVKKIDELTKKQEEHNLTIGKTKEQIDQAKQAQDDAATNDLQQQAEAINMLLEKGLVHQTYVEGLQNEGDVKVALDNRSRQVYEAELARINALIVARDRYSAALAQGAILEAQAAAQKQVDADWKRLDKKIEDDLASAIVDGGGKGFKKLMRDMEIAFAKMILRPILAPISASFTDLVYPNATQAGGVAGVGGGGGVGGAINAANSAANLYKTVSGGVSSLGGGIAAAGNMVGSSTMNAFGAGMANTSTTMTTMSAQEIYASMGMTSEASAAGAGASAGSALSTVGTVAAGVAAGILAGRAISGQYEIAGSKNAAPMAGSAIGGYVGWGMGGAFGAAVGAAIGGAIGGAINRAFGRGPTELQAAGIQGSIGADGSVTGTTYAKYHQDGGWFKSDKNWTDRDALSSDIVNSLSTGFTTMKSTVTQFAQTLGVGNDALSTYSKNFDILLDPLKEVKGNAQQQASIQAENQKIAKANADKIAEFFTTVGDEMSDKLIPNMKDFAQAGETASQTLERLSNTFKTTDQIAAMLGKSAEKAFGSKGLDSDAARESLISLAGGLDKLSAYATNYATNFLTEAEKVAPAQKALKEALSQLGLSSVTTREQFKDTIQALDLTTEKDRKLFVSLMQLQDAFVTVTDSQKELEQGVQDARDALKDAYQEEVDAIEKVNDKLKTFIDTMKDMRSAALLGDKSPLTPEQKYLEAKRQFDEVATAAKNGDPEAQDKFKDSFDAFLEASRTVNASGDKYQKDFQYAMQASKDAQKYAQQQLDVGKATLSALALQVQGLIDVNDSVKTVTQAIQDLAKAMGKAGMDTSIIGKNNGAAVESLYGTLLNRHSDEAGLKFWTDMLAKGVSIDDIAKAFTTSQEYMDSHSGSAGSGAMSSSSSKVQMSLASQSGAVDNSTSTGAIVNAIQSLQTEVSNLRSDQQQQTGDIITSTVKSNKDSAAMIASATNSSYPTSALRVMPD